MSVQELTAEGFEALLAQEGIVFIDFWANWCGPCKSFAKTFDTVSEENKDIAFSSVNIEVESELAETLQILSIPHLMVVKNGVIIYSDSGTLSKSSLNELVIQSRSAEVESLEEAE